MYNRQTTNLRGLFHIFCDVSVVFAAWLITSNLHGIVDNIFIPTLHDETHDLRATDDEF